MHTLFLIVYASVCNLPGNITAHCTLMKSFNTSEGACAFTKTLDKDWAGFKVTEHGLLSSPSVHPIELVCISRIK